MMNCKVIFLILCFQLISIQSIQSAESSISPLVLPEEEPEEPIRLHRFISADVIQPFHCFSTNDVKIDSMLYGFNLRNGVMKNRQCEKDTWVLNWNKDDLGQQSKIVECSASSPTYGEGDSCEPCICIKATDEPIPYRINSTRTFRLRPEETDQKNNMVVTGLRFRRRNRAIHLKIQQAKLLENGEVDINKSWTKLEDFVKISKEDQGDTWFSLNASEDDMNFSYDTRTIFLDQIFVPNDFVITGVKLVKIDPSEGHKGIKLQVKGTKFDSNHRLISNTDKWFDYHDNVAQNISYNRKRTEIPLDNCTDPTLTKNNIEIVDTNRFIRFRSTDLKKDWLNHVIPYFNSEPAESVYKRPIRGVGLSYKGREGYGGYITVKVFEDKSALSDVRPIIVTPIVETPNVPKTTPNPPTKESPKGAQKGLAAKVHCPFFIIAISVILFILL